MTKTRKTALVMLTEAVNEAVNKYKEETDFSKDEELIELIGCCDKIKEAANKIRKKHAKKLIKEHEAAIEALKAIQ